MLRTVWVVSLILSSVLSAPANVRCPADGGCSKEDGCPCDGEIWAILVAGAMGYSSYRNQADILHAYQILHRHGVNDSHIITMMYDDIAYNAANPDQGSVINKPGGPNVYTGVVKDYTGNDVTAKNFVNILTGNSEAMSGIGSGKVLKSGPKDHVFIYFDAHGGLFILNFPYDGVLYKDELTKTLKKMHKKQMFKKLLFYLQSCDSGSLFNGSLPHNVEILAETATQTWECAQPVYWDDHMQTYLGNAYGVAWMEDIDSEEHHKNMTTETLLQQFKHVVARVNTSHPSTWGFKNMLKDNITDYFGKSKNGEADQSERAVNPFQDAVSEREVALHTLDNRIRLAKTEVAKKALQEQKEELLKRRKEVDELLERILSHVAGENVADLEVMENSRHYLELEKMPCYRTLVDSFSEKCVNINRNPYVLWHLYKFANLCATDYASTEDVLQILSALCTEQHRALSDIE